MSVFFLLNLSFVLSSYFYYINYLYYILWLYLNILSLLSLSLFFPLIYYGGLLAQQRNHLHDARKAPHVHVA